MMNLLMMILNYGGHVKPLYTRCASAKGVLVRLQGAPPGCMCHTLTSFVNGIKANQGVLLVSPSIQRSIGLSQGRCGLLNTM
jgi:hypothetical protein